MAALPSLILLELNELVPELLDRFIAEGRLPNFKRLREESLVFTTDAQEEGDNLNPWIQWVTVHTGLSFAEHGVFRLGEGRQCPAPGIVELASDAGRKVLQFGSMNIRFRTPLNGAAVPDPWATDVDPYPAELEPYFRFVQHQVVEHTNESRSTGLKETLGFLRFMVTHGLSPSTVTTILKQLLSERDGRNGWRRVSILDRLQLDVFSHYYRRLRPQLATFFLNSVAHLQHTHWRNLEPEKFEIRPSDEEQEEYAESVQFAYEQQDVLIGRFLELAGGETTVVLCSALSQQPCLDWEERGAKRFYRPHDYADLMRFAGISEEHKCSPVMSEEFSVLFESEDAANRGEAALQALEVAGEPAFWINRDGNEIFGGCRLYHELSTGAALENTATGQSMPFFDLLYQADSLKSGIHHPDGVLWIRLPERRSRVEAERAPLVSVAPTLMRLLGLEPPEAMAGKPLV